MQEIINKLRKKDDISKEFIEAFGDFVRGYERYLKWMEAVKKIQGHYHNKDSFPGYAKMNIDLIESIKENGINEPMVLNEKDIIDGHHRLIIADVCKKELKYSYLPTVKNG